MSVIDSSHPSCLEILSKTCLMGSSRNVLMDFDRGLAPCVNRAGILNSDDPIRSRALLNVAADCCKRFTLTEFQSFVYHVVAKLRDYAIPLLRSSVVRLLRCS